jgi:hypothetical protein
MALMDEMVSRVLLVRQDLEDRMASMDSGFRATRESEDPQDPRVPHSQDLLDPLAPPAPRAGRDHEGTQVTAAQGQQERLVPRAGLGREAFQATASQDLLELQ